MDNVEVKIGTWCHEDAACLVLSMRSGILQRPSSTVDIQQFVFVFYTEVGTYIESSQEHYMKTSNHNLAILKCSSVSLLFVYRSKALEKIHQTFWDYGKQS